MCCFASVLVRCASAEGSCYRLSHSSWLPGQKNTVPKRTRNSVRVVRRIGSESVASPATIITSSRKLVVEMFSIHSLRTFVRRRQ